ncbi:cell cycle progression protein 1-like isoform X1 [Xyrauchen texanus]|uniref:cell cycle progression protein 1-like isoform X1 n=1 Tax=Xyrauchen texanus TaxID=154827 RepID=UPI0022421542|nr:cell cycle progression protein 1-like isoform X1 [Xyrauchen texanus]XP_052008577.1 cell cycle progression protein 1-like isoform X1 [Xyrauchen texanus]XP_052008578.1 cell cycle progression protein 1-like isoform X1 [Xyrauchen texanus]XP_052008579.1 cell cycle progression protein 1-like isoform X1 [Xyrauchen texanus]
MSESSSDTESSCGWTVISNEGSDIETLGPDNVGDCDGEVSLTPDIPAAECEEESLVESSLELTLRAEVTSVVEPARETGEDVAREDHTILCSSSENSDIITLGDTREADIDTWVEPVAKETEETGSEELYLGSSSSSHYTFREVETMDWWRCGWGFSRTLWEYGSQLQSSLSFSVFPVDQPVQRDSSNSSSEEDDDEMKSSPVVRRRRVRWSTNGLEPGDSHEPQRRQEVLEEIQAPHQGQISGTLNKCILLALLIAISMGFGHFYGTVQIQERQRIVEKSRVNELETPCKREMDIVSKEVVENLKEDLEEKQDMVLSLTSIMDKITKENQHLRFKQEELQAQRQNLYNQLSQAKSEMGSRQKDLTMENQHLKITLEKEEASLSALQEELRYLRGQIRELEERGAGTDSILSENQRLKGHLQEEKQKVRSFISQREALMSEAQVLRKELDKERKVTDKLKEDLEEMSQKEEDMEGKTDPETKELQARLLELENKLRFEQQRSDLWERLYVESKEKKAKGDQDVKTKIPKDGMMGKVKETFDAVKNSTKEFVHHHKEQIKKAKEAVKENLRKFSDSVKSTFRHFKYSASNVFNRGDEKRFQERKDAKPQSQTFQQDGFKEQGNKRGEDIHWQPQKPLHRHPRKSTIDSFHGDSNTRKPGTQKDQSQKMPPKGCSGVFDCAYQESMSLFNKAMDPIRADEFNELLRSYLQKEVGYFRHWRELESFINNFFHNGVFIHDQMLFTDFVSSVEDYLEEMDEYHSLDDDVFEDLDDYIYRHIFGDTYLKYFGPSRPFEGPGSKGKPWRHCLRQKRKHQQPRPRPQRAKKWSQSGRYPNQQFADVKIELGPMPFDPKY